MVCVGVGALLAAARAAGRSAGAAGVGGQRAEGAGRAAAVSAGLLSPPAAGGSAAHPASPQPGHGQHRAPLLGISTAPAV